MLATAAVVLALAAPATDPQLCQTKACEQRVFRRHMRRVVKPYREWLSRVSWCESRNDSDAIGAGGLYTGLYQFDDQTWRSVGGTGRAMDASRLEQSYRAVKLRKARGKAPWPVCGV